MRHKNRNYYGDEKIKSMVNAYKIDAISIGNGTFTRNRFLYQENRFDKPVQVFIVSEAGASVYSASKIAREFPIMMSPFVVRFP
jgi:uncharacterized protein